VLLADSNTDSRRILKVGLEKYGYLVVEAKDGKEAIDILSTNHKINIVLTDTRMPKFSSVHLLKYTKNYLPEMPVVLMSGLASDTMDSDRAAKLYGARGFIKKPFLFTELIIILEKSVEPKIK
jgi:DNA-binding NtrC family response regulator